MEAKLTSTVIAGVALDTDREPHTMTITFRNGACYEYRPRPDADPPDDMRVLYISFVNAPSAGLFFAERIRNILPFRRKTNDAKDRRTLR